MDKVQNFGKNIQSSFTPFAQKTQQFVKEQFGQGGAKTELPADYVDLERRVDALKQAHQKMLAVTSQYTNEAYDYPPNLRESFNDLGRTISEKVHLLSAANTPQEASSALTAPPQAKPQPKTFNHAIARAALASSQVLAQSGHRDESVGTAYTGGGEKSEAPRAKDTDALAGALEKYALAEEKIGEARLNQDAQIQSRFLAGWSTTLNTQLTFATRARKGVDNARLALDATKAKVSGGAGGQGAPDEGEIHLSEAQRAEVEKKEDEFVGETEEAEKVMRQTLDTPEPLRNLSELIAAQLEFHKRSFEILTELAPVIDGLQEEQEAEYRKNRGNA